MLCENERVESPLPWNGRRLARHNWRQCDRGLGARVDVEAVRNTKDVDLLVRREDFDHVIEAAQSVGFVYQNVAGVDLFLDGPNGSVRSAIRIVCAGEGPGRLSPSRPRRDRVGSGT